MLALARPTWRWMTAHAMGRSALRLQPMPRVRGPALLGGSVRRFSTESPPLGGQVSGEVLDGAVRAIEHGGEQAMGRFVRGLSPAAQEALQNYLNKQIATEVRMPRTLQCTRRGGSGQGGGGKKSGSRDADVGALSLLCFALRGDFGGSSLILHPT